MAKKQPDVTMTEAKDSNEAINFIFIGLKFYLVHHTKKTLFVLFGILLGLGMFAKDYLTTDRVNIIKDVKPMLSSPTGFRFEFPERLHAEIKDGKIIFGGEAYAYADESYEIHKIKDENAVLIYDKKHRRVVKLEISFNKLKE